MIYLLYGTQEYLIEKEIQKIIKDNKIDKININEYDLENTLIETIIDDASTISLFADNKMIIVDNSYIFTGTTNKKLLKQNVEVLETYLDNINENTVVIFKINKDSIDGRKKIVSKIKKIGKVLEFNEITNINKYIKDLFENYNITSENISLFHSRVGDNLFLIENEIKKIKTYKGNDLEITKEDIINLTTKSINIDIFNLIENIISKNKEDAIQSYNEMIKLGEEPIKIVIMLANQIRIIYQAKELSKLGYSEKNIADILEIHPYRVKIALSNAYRYDSDELLKNLYKLSDIDINIKQGNIDKNLSLEMFILGL